MKTTNGKIRAAQMALAKLANAEAPLPVIMEYAPLLDACDPIIGEAKRREEIGEDVLRQYCAEETELPDVTVPLYPGFAMTYLEYAALRCIARIGEV